MRDRLQRPFAGRIEQSTKQSWDTMDNIYLFFFNPSAQNTGVNTIFHHWGQADRPTRAKRDKDVSQKCIKSRRNKLACPAAKGDFTLFKLPPDEVVHCFYSSCNRLGLASRTGSKKDVAAIIPVPTRGVDIFPGSIIGNQCCFIREQARAAQPR